MEPIDMAERDRRICASDEHVGALAEQYDLSRSRIYQIRAAGRRVAEPEAEPFAPYNDLAYTRHRSRDAYRQLADAGFTRFGGSIAEEFQRELQDDGGVKLFRQMALHPVNAATLFAITMSMRKVDWWTEAGGSTDADKRAEEFLEQCREDMSQDWSEVIAQAFAMLKFGFQLGELVYKKRMGQNPRAYVKDPARSRFNDGLIGWRRWQFISPESLSPGNRWDLDERGRVQGANQAGPPSYKEITIPIEKLLLFRTTVEFDNPEGLSVLRPAYVPWYYATNLAEVEAIGAERLGLGLPVIYMGEDTSRSNDAKSAWSYSKSIVRNVRADEQMGIVFPYAKMGAGAAEGKGILFELVSPPSRGLVNFNETITRWEQRMAMPVLAQFIFLGMQKVGTQALASTSVDFFTEAVGAWADAVAGVINRFAIPRLFALNPMKLEQLPVLRHGETGVPNLQVIGEYINALVGAQVIMPYPELEEHLLEIAGLPERPEQPHTVRAQPPAELSEEYALRLKQGGPLWERSTNAYQMELQRAWDAWAEAASRRLAGIADEQQRQEAIDEEVAVILAALAQLGRKRLPEALSLGLGKAVASPDGLTTLAQAIRDNETYLYDKLGPAIKTKLLKEIVEQPLNVGEAGLFRSVLGTMTARVGGYAGGYWVLISKGVIDKLNQRPDVNTVPVRMVLDDRAKHCWECPKYAGEYENIDAFLNATNGRVPGQFACWSNCRCHLEFKLPDGEWSRW